MRTPISLSMLLMLLCCCLCVATETKAQAITGYTSIDYDPNTDTLDAYSETDLDWDLTTDYDAYVILTVRDDNGFVIASGTARDYYGEGFISVERIVVGTTPGTTYTALGAHKAYTHFWDTDYVWPYNVYYYDNYYFTYFEGQGIWQPWYYYFPSPGFRATRRSSPLIHLGTTYDSDSVTITVPHPIKFHQVGPGAGASNGTLYFQYAWDSSTGNLADLSNCEVGENVSYPSSSQSYYPPSPPFHVPAPGVDNPTVNDFRATLGTFYDTNSPYPGGFATPYIYKSDPATQQFHYHCLDVNNSKYVSLGRPITITRTVSQNTDGSWKFTITKSGASASINPLP